MSPQDNSGFPSVVPTLSSKDVQRQCEALMEREASEIKRVKYNDYTATERAQIGKYAAENGPACAVRHFSQVPGRKYYINI